MALVEAVRREHRQEIKDLLGPLGVVVVVPGALEEADLLLLRASMGSPSEAKAESIRFGAMLI